MTEFDRSPDGLVFSAAVQAIQERMGSRGMFRDAQWPVEISPELQAFIVAQRSVFLATASADGRPYVQHRGGPPGFLKVLDGRTIGMADLEGNRQYVSLGNLSENDCVQLLLIDFVNRRRVKIWGRARMVEDNADLVQRLRSDAQRAPARRALLITVEAWDVNCPQHIPQRFEAEDVISRMAQRDQRIAELEHELAVLQAQLSVRDICGDDLWD